MIRSLVSAPLTNRAFIKLHSIVLSGTTDHESTYRSDLSPACSLYLHSVSGSTIKFLLYIGVGCLSRRSGDPHGTDSSRLYRYVPRIGSARFADHLASIK